MAPSTLLTVTGSELITPHLQRVHFSGDLSEFAQSRWTDRYVKLVFGKPGVEYPEPFDLHALRAALPAESHPLLRTYTVRRLDVSGGTLSIDFVLHGSQGVAGPWAAAAQPGEELRVLGPGGKYAPRPEADWHLLVGDLAALPAIASSLEVLEPDAVARVILEVPGPEDEIELAGGPGVQVRWIHSGDAVPAGPEQSPLAVAVRELDWLPGQVHVFVHGEASSVMRGVRPYIVRERRVPTVDVSISGYWKRGEAEEVFKAPR